MKRRSHACTYQVNRSASWSRSAIPCTKVTGMAQNNTPAIHKQFANLFFDDTCHVKSKSGNSKSVPTQHLVGHLVQHLVPDRNLEKVQQVHVWCITALEV